MIIENNVLIKVNPDSTNKEIIIPEMIKQIGAEAFSGCSNIEKIIIPSSVKTISDFAFINCKNLTSIIIPDSVTNIGDNLFAGCRNLKNVEISKNIKSLGNHTFINCANLEIAALPNSIKYIPDRAFFNCYALKKISLPNGITSVEGSSFGNCFSLETIDWPDTLLNIENFAFTHCRALKKIILPNSVTNIGIYAFYNCINLEEIKLSDNLKFIERGLFTGCVHLKTIAIPSNVISIKENAFFDCFSLETINFQDFICQIDHSIIEHTYLKWMYINNDRTMSICKDKKEHLSNNLCEIDLYSEEGKNFLNNNYRVNYVTLHKWKEKEKIKFIPPDYTLMIFPYNQIDKYYLNKNSKRWRNLVTTLGFDKLEGIEKINSLTDLMKIYYAIGGFSDNQGECERAYNYILNYVAKTNKENITPNEIGAAIHARFSKLVLKDNYNKQFAKFFMRYYKKNPDFMKFRLTGINGEVMENQDYLCSAHNEFDNILKYYPNKVVTGNSRNSLLTPLFVAEHCKIKLYDNVDEENKKLAEIVGHYGYSQGQFEHIQEIYNEAKKTKDTYIIKASKDNEENNITFRLLEKDDPLGFVLGDITNCCQHIGGEASSCVEDGYLNPNAGFIVFEETETKRIVGQAYIWYDSKTKTICYDNIEIPLKISEEFEKEYAKIKTEDFLKAIEKSAESIMDAMNKEGIKVERVTTGEGYNDLKKELEKHYVKEIAPKSKNRSYSGYSDAKEAQYILKTYEEITNKYSNQIQENIKEASKIINNIRRKRK